MERILAIGAHPDDIEIGCGGTLTKLITKGYYVMMLIVSNGQNWEGKNPNVRIEEQKKACDKLNIKDVIFLGQKDGEIKASPRLNDAIEKIIIENNIDTVFSHYFEDSHQDHVELSKSVQVASRRCINYFMYESLTSINFHPNCYSDISKYSENKKAVLTCFESQLEKYNKRKHNLIEYSSAKDKLNGIKSGVEFAEGFYARKCLLDSIR
ncbi:PIG-L deacetylase family protein [Culicoidibacter larvae]|uniref:PIG-L family deacetylase n=1 Tax=Culicoidibacter larvae TaxID=2579976 RepID=A0A5R8QA15_9FIRM|nr:PIG-L deacetylase family protein [Culicoidibacter larvae]TLG72697.1 PIG-L family deacetylase [Culicoidibacter larvae]